MNKISSEGNAGSRQAAEVRKPQGILIFGMHRSGTSACTRVLNMLGCALSEELICAGEGNENGHWEALGAVNLNDEMLASAGSSHEDWGPINPEWRQSALRDQMVGRASAVVRDHIRLGPLFAIKDPRMCRLGDVWIEAAIAADVDPLVLVMLRNPLEVIGSLEARDLMATGYAELLWLRHVLDAEHFSRGGKRIFFRYDQLLSNWQSLIPKCKEGLGVALPRNSPKVHAEISQFLSQSHRHHHVDPAMALNDPTRSPWLREAYGIILRWSESGEDAVDYPALDEMRAELGRSYGVFARLLLSPDITGEVASGRWLRDQISLLQQDSAAQSEALRIATEAAESERAAAHHREAELAAALHQAQAGLAAVEAEIAAEREACHAAEHHHAEALVHAAEAAEGERAAAHQREAELAAALAHAQAGIAAVKAEIVAEREACHAAEHHHAEALVHAAEAAEGERAAAHQREAELAAALAHAQAGTAAVKAEIVAERQSRIDADHRHAEARGDLQNEQLRNAELTGQVASLQSAILQRQEELAQLLAQLREAEESRLRAELANEREQEQRLALEQAIAAANDQIAALQQQLAQTQAAAGQQADALTADLAQLTLMLKSQETAAEQAAAEASASLAEWQRLSEQVVHISAAAEQRIATLTTDLTRLTVLLKEQEETAEAAHKASLAETQHLSEEIVHLTGAANQAEEARTMSERQLAARFDELARLTAILAEESRRAEASDTQSQWLRDVRRLEESFPAWWAVMPAAWRQRRTHRRYQRAGLFDAAAYLALYPDVAAQGMDPVRHYILHGMAEGRTRPVPF
jgi:hypothetical protein